jgi:hypothetical protein
LTSARILSTNFGLSLDVGPRFDLATISAS